MNYPNNRNQNNRGNNNQISPSPQNAVNNLPYGFVPIGDATVPRKPRVNLGKDDDSLYTGYINCSMYALNELCVGNSHQDLGNDKTAILPLIVNGKILISSYTLKGCIANFMAAYLKLPITRMNNHRYSFRPNNAPSGSQILTGAGLVEKINDDGSIIVKKFTENTFAFVRDNFNTQNDMVVKHGIRYTNMTYNRKKDRCLDAHKYTIGNRIDFNIPPHYIKESSFVFYKYHDGIDGSGFLGQKADHPSFHKSFGVKLDGSTEPDFEPELYTISATKLDEYNRTIDTLARKNEGHLQDHPILTKHKIKDNQIDELATRIEINSTITEGSLIFFEHIEENTEILTLGKHYRYRWAFSHDLHSFTIDYQPWDLNSIKQGFTNTIEELFGYSYGDIPSQDKDGIPLDNLAKSAKVHFSFAEHVSGTGELKKEKWLPRPGSPKPSSFEFYLRQNYKLFLNKEELKGTLTTYGDPARMDFAQQPRLSGRKFYYSTTKTPYNDAEVQEAVIKTVKLENILHPHNNRFPEFRFTIHYENLLIEELQLLRFALCLGENSAPTQGVPLDANNLLCHQIGYGKNNGMGAVKITIGNTEGIEQIYRYTNNDKSIDVELVEVENMLLSDNVSLFKLHNISRHYPIDRKAKEDATKKHIKEEKPDNDSDGVGTYSWHTKLKNDDLKARREKGVQK